MTIEISGILKHDYKDSFSRLFLMQQDGLLIDLVGRFIEIQNSFPSHKAQINYWISDKPQTKDGMIERYLERIYGAIDSEYETTTSYGSSLTGAWSNHYTTLKVGGHNLYDELQQHIDKFILIEINLSL